MVNDSGCPPDEVFLAIRDGDETVSVDHGHIQQCGVCQRRHEQLEAEIVYLREFESAVEQDTVAQGSTAAIERSASNGSNGSASNHPSAPTDALPPRELSRFQLIQLLGTGAFGEVHLAHDPQLDRKVAIKVARTGMLVGKSKVDRFQREARSAAQLHHPHIIPVYDVGQTDAANYIVYEYVPGQTLGAMLQSRGKLPQSEAARLISQLAGALEYAHSLGIVHRDIKPDNILIDAEGEPHIADFGLAYRDDGDTTRTRAGVVVGTPAYMSPEQASGHGREADARADIWSLGVLFQELLTSDRPFGGSLKGVLDSIQTTDPNPIRDKSVSPDLVAICLTCLAKDPASRYSTALALKDDLDRWSRGEPVKVRPLGVGSRTLRWAKRNPAIALLMAAFTAALLIGTSASSFFAWSAQRQAQRVRTATGR